MRRLLVPILLILLANFCWPEHTACQGGEDIRKLRIAFHIFNDDGGLGNFQEDSIQHLQFFIELVDWINHRMLNLDTLRPAVSSGFVKSTNTQLVVDTILFHQDSYAWDCSDSLDSEYMRVMYVDKADWMTYQQKHQTLPIFLGDNYHVVGGHVSQIGSKRLIAMRGIYTMFSNWGMDKTVYECGRNIFHELGHAMGLNHNFQGGPNGDQCDECEDNGCPQEGTSNNLMDYWPTYGGGLSECQLDIINKHLDGDLGTIGDVVINDSCWYEDIRIPMIISGTVIIEDTVYFRRPVVIEDGGELIVKGLISINQDCDIVVEHGGRLELNGGTLTNLCGDLWKGIQVFGDYQGKRAVLNIHNNSSIEHALSGLILYGDGDLSVTSCNFSNCVIGIQISQVNGLNINGLNFKADNDYNRIEEGYHLKDFIHLNQSTVAVNNSLFVNIDHFRSLSSGQSGIGINSEDSRLTSQGNNFEYLTTGIKATTQNEIGTVFCYNDNYFNCLNAMSLSNIAFAEIADNSFEITKLDEFHACGLVSLKPGYFDIQRNSFKSHYGGGIIGMYLKGSTRATQRIAGNTFSNLDWGIIHKPDSLEPAWPNDFPYHPGLGLSNNTYVDVPMKYTVQFSDGQGISQTSENFPRERERFSQAINWSIGGIALLSKPEGLAMVMDNPAGITHNSLQHKFFINALSNETELQQPVNPDYDLLYAKWADTVHMLLCKSSDYEEINLASTYYREHPWLLREASLVRQNLLEFDEWPQWLIEEFSDISANASVYDADFAWHLHNFIKARLDLSRKLAIERNEALEVYIIFDHNQVLEPDQITTPTYLFLPAIPYPEVTNAAFDVFPNPVSEVMYIKPDDRISLDPELGLQYEIFSLKGQLVKSGRVTQFDDLIIHSGNLPSGLYSICLRDVKSFYGVKKFIILHP
jgi:hypothetical protein